jgi:hypothetical protein
LEPFKEAPTACKIEVWLKATADNLNKILNHIDFGAYIATTAAGKFEGLAMGPYPPGWEPDSILHGSYAPDSLRNASHVKDPTLTAMLKAQRRA